MQTDINLGHLGFEWKQNQYGLDFDANRPLGDSQRLSFGIGYRRTELKVKSKVLDPFAFDSIVNLNEVPFSTSNSIPILEYDQDFTKFNRLTAYLQDSIDLSDDIVFSIGTKMEDNDLTGSGFQRGFGLLGIPMVIMYCGLGFPEPIVNHRYVKGIPPLIQLEFGLLY